MTPLVTHGISIIFALMKRQEYFTQLTGVRAIAGYMVFVHHYIYQYQSKLPNYLFAMLSELHIGVTVFFVLSGFLIAYRYLDKVEISRKWLYQYFKNRVARIYPMFFLLTTATFLFYGWFKHFPQVTLGGYFFNVTFLRSFCRDIKFTGIAQGWSLTVEECFYATAPLIFLLRKKINIWVMAVVILTVGVLLSLIFKDHYVLNGLFASPQFVFGYTFFGRCLEFFIGIQLALIIRNREYKERKGFAYTLIGWLGIIGCLYAYTFFPEGDRLYLDSNKVVRILINNLVCASFIGIMFYGLITETNRFRTFLSTSVMKLLGESSYIFYLIHFGFAFELLCLAVPMFGGARFFILFIMLNIMSILLFKFVEQPLNKWIREHFN